MIYSKTKDGFDEAFNKAMEMVKTREQRYAKHESSLREFENMKDSYASYILCKKKREHRVNMDLIFWRLIMQVY